MGMIRIEVGGSFGAMSRTFSAMDTGHADAVAQAIEWLSRDVLPAAIRNDHTCHSDNQLPRKGFANRANP